MAPASSALRRLPLLLSILAAAQACDGDLPPPAPPVPTHRDAGFVDVGTLRPDRPADVADVDGGGASVDADVGPMIADPDGGDGGGAGDSEAGVGPGDGPILDADGSPGDGPDTPIGDAGDGGGADSDSGAVSDAGLFDIGNSGRMTDGDGDNISDFDEGNGLIDVDGDGDPDSVDADSDGDGIPDIDEAGDTDIATPPRDSDGDTVPDFRDRDSDNDGLPDSLEGTADPDMDQIPNYLDDDSDGDGISDQREGAVDPDNDMIPAFLDDDSDGDGILDADEGAGDPDRDGRPSFLDDDSDGDGISDADEGTGDPDMDQIPSFLDDDSDGDTIRDLHEGADDPDGDLVPSYLDTDSDGDGIDDADEVYDVNLQTPPDDSDLDQTPDFLDLDSDNDTISDQHEGSGNFDGDSFPDRLDIDSDNDSILDDAEAGDRDLATPPVNTDGTEGEDFRDLDADGDTILDITERDRDPDNDGIGAFQDTDSDGDTWLDAIEAGDTSTATPPVDTDGDFIEDYLDLDSDSDTLPDAIEPGCPAGPDRLDEDSDDDGFIDAAEVALGTDPCVDTPVIEDFYFILPPGGPGDDAPLQFADTGLDVADIAINMDSTSSMLGELNDLRASLLNLIIPGMTAVIPDVAYSFSVFEDYPVTPFGGWNDRPFRLLQRMTLSNMAVLNSINALTLGRGDDLPESGLESLYQIATGAGTAWTGGTLGTFDPSANRLPGVADGTIGGVGFRGGALPVVVHITDAQSHWVDEYTDWDVGISAASSTEVRDAVSGIGARVVTIASSNIPRPLDPAVFGDLCDQTSPRFFGTIQRPTASDRDWFRIDGAQTGDSIRVEIFAERLGSTLDSYIEVFDDQTQEFANDDGAGQTSNDSLIEGTIFGPGPYYLMIRSPVRNNGTGTENTGWYFAEVSLNGVPMVRNPSACLRDGNDRASATLLVPRANAALPADTALCAADCEGEFLSITDPLTMPYAISEQTNAVVPPCAWDVFGAGRPANCPSNQCCTEIDGAGEAPNAAGMCPLAFRIEEDGTGLGATMVTGVEALVKAGAFTITTRVRQDPAELALSGVDTACFITSVIPVSATQANQCVAQPRAVDLTPPSPQLDSFVDVTPGADLEFQVNAINLDSASSMPCAEANPLPTIYRAFIDVVADGVTVVDTRDVIILVPGTGPGGGSN